MGFHQSQEHFHLLERDKELEALSRVAERASMGHGSVVLLSGEAGIGKTSILREFSGRAGQQAKTLWGGCEALFTPRTLGPLQDMAAKLGPTVAGLLDEEAPQDRLFPAVLRALESSPQSQILIFEDVHWADNATLDLVKYLGRRIAPLRVVLVLTLRPDEITSGHPVSQVLGDLPAQSTVRIELEPLSRQGVLRLAALLGRPGDGLFEATDGNPFFVTELLARADGAGTLPRSVRDAVWSRLARVPSAERELLELLSIAPGPVEPWLVQFLSGGLGQLLVDRCIDLGLLVRGASGTVRFRHELARQATLERMPPAAQRHLHQRICEAMAAHDPAQTIIPVALRVHHAKGADDAANVITFAPVAARHASRLGAHREAARFFRLALDHASHSDKETAAQLHEEWSYEAGIAMRIDDDIIAARKNAIALWRELGRPDKVSLNLRWLSRLHWYRGESALANQYIQEAMEALKDQPPSAELAMVYSASSQMHMLHDRTDEALLWGEKALALAATFNDIETRVHALNNVGSALLFSGREGGKAYMEESLALALKNGLHEQAARAYTNYAEYAIVAKEFALAERILAEGIAFDSRHDLDAWTFYLIGRKAQLLMEQGKLREAETVAKGVIATEGQTLVMKLPARTVLARLCVRMGRTESAELLATALRDALATGEPQNILPVRFALVEQAYLTGDTVPGLEHLNAIAAMNLESFDPWERGEFAVWWKRFGLDAHPAIRGSRIALPRQLELDGDAEAAGRKWQELGLPYEAALCLMQIKGIGPTKAGHEALSILEAMGAAAASGLYRSQMAARGVKIRAGSGKRGPYKPARSHPLGLTAREVQILGLMAQGMGNSDIARRLVRSQRTVEHHVSAVLGKLNVHTRVDVVLRLRNEPWLLPEAVAEK